MTTLLQKEQVDLARSIRNSAAVFLVMVMIEKVRPGRAVTPYEVAPILELDTRTVEKHMKSLCASNRAVFDGRGYVLTAGHALFLGMDQAQEIGMAPAEAQRRQALAINQAHADPALISAQSVQAVTHTLCVSLEDRLEEELFDSKKSSSSDSKSAQNVQLRPGVEGTYAIANGLTVVPQIMGLTFEDGRSIYRMEVIGGEVTSRDILNATEVLEGFGDVALHVLPVDAIKPELALGWVAKGYDDRQRLSNPPAGLVVSRLRDKPITQPPRKYLKDPTQYLPDDYCDLLHLKKYDCKSCVDTWFSTQAAYDEHVQTLHTVQAVEEEPEGCEYVVNEQLAPMWKTVLDNLQMEMPRASFDTWLRDTVALSHDGEVLTVGARNQYARDWLESRMSEVVNRLSGMQVSFVVASAD